MGSIVGQKISAAIDGKQLDFKETLSSALMTGTINCISSIGASIGGALQEMPEISTTTTAVSNSLNATWSLFSEMISDSISFISDLIS